MSAARTNGKAQIASAAAYLLARGFPDWAIEEVGWRVEPLGARRGYGLPLAAAGALVWVIPYRHRNGSITFERIRLIADADVERFGGGKYRQPAGRGLALYDPYGALEGPLDAALLVEGEANAVAVHVMDPDLSVIGLPGQSALSAELADTLGHVPVVYVWIDRHEKAAPANAERITRLLCAAGVEEVRLFPETGGADANDVLRELGTENAEQKLAAWFAQAMLLAPAPLAAGTEPSWPVPLQRPALHGLAGEVVATIEPHSEADPAALLLQYLVAFGNAAGRSAGFCAEADFHATNLYVVLVGETAKGRKGSSWGQVGRIFDHADHNWRQDRVVSGASSGEGLIWAVRDPIMERVAVKKDGKVIRHEEQESDPGVEDKRLLDVESEFASVLRVMRRDGSTLSATIRQAWDRGDLQSLTKNAPARARGAHISMIGHITREELRRELNATDAANGFANRFIFACVKRSKALPEGGNLREHDLAGLAERTREALRFASTVTEMRRDAAARALWAEAYEPLSDGKPGLFGAVISRAEAQVMRMACAYALLDLHDVVGVKHLRAALAVWDYCEQSARHIFGSSLGDPFADGVLEALRGAPNRELTRTELRDRFARHVSAADMQRALGLIEQARLATRGTRPSGGRPVETWRAL